MSENKQAYISHVHLKGYKSIRDMEIDLLPGLNIIIGPNGSGKTNFLDFLSENFYGKRKPFNNEFEQQITFSNSKQKKVLGYFYIDENGKKLYKIEFQSFQNGKAAPRAFQIYDENKLIHEYDEDIRFLSGGLAFFFPISKKVYFNHVFTENITITEEFNEGNFFYSSSPSLNSNYSNHRGHNSDEFFCKLIIWLYNEGEFLGTKFENEYDRIKQVLRDLTVIKDLKVQKENMNVESYELDADRLILTCEYSNVMQSLFFLVNDSWLNFNQLSDGTKRLFYLVLVTLSEDGILLTEEPELGIHPDQLKKLIQFLKEQSKEKQIIITTHSPEVLNILGKDELDRIIVTRYDAEKGTQMHKLSPQQIKKGQAYMKKVGHLSDFWVHSNLEEYEVEEN